MIRKVGTITVALLRQNRWLVLLLIAWPWIFLALLTLPGRNFSPDDIRSLLQQEYFYGIALTMFLAASLLGAELRARRVAAVLCRAVSRNQYLAALWMTALVPAILFALSVFFSVWIAAAGIGFSLKILLPFILSLMLVELWMTVCGVLYSLFLPALLASLATGLTAVVLVAAGTLQLGSWLGFGSLLLPVLQENAGLGSIAGSQMGIAVVSMLLQVGVVALLSQQIFRRKDLPSSGD
ncbi:MAG TPA: hypothetical protein VHX63_00560 [Acidobacteriaceae bacterium]|jgi:hypothetical protein|nr:hypothetical protein [Acidobacteriaceae bacterium]